VWSLGGTHYNNFLSQYFINYNGGGGWYVTISPIITANWYAAGDKAWTLPFGGGFGRVINVGGKLPVNLSLSAYYNVLQPQFCTSRQVTLAIERNVSESFTHSLPN